MAWCRPGDKPLSEPMMVNLLMHICVTRPQWVTESVILFDKVQHKCSVKNYHPVLYVTLSPDRLFISVYESSSYHYHQSVDSVWVLLDSQNLILNDNSFLVENMRAWTLFCTVFMVSNASQSSIASNYVINLVTPGTFNSHHHTSEAQNGILETSNKMQSYCIQYSYKTYGWLSARLQ